MVKIAIDAGHGLNTAGKRTPDGMKEFEFNVKVAEYLKNELMKYENVNVLFVHDPTGKRDVPLSERTKKANDWKADLYLSLHANAFGNGGWNTAGGTETYIHPITPQRTKDIANIIHGEIIKATGLRNRGVKTADFQVLRGTNMSAVLVEHAFMTNKEEAKLLKDDKFRKDCAKSHATAIASYYKLKKKPETKPELVKDDGKLYKVQIGAFAQKENAEKLKKEMQALGYKPFIKIE
ncbi:N-acetylmuramoyl-L-alanine amidase [Irregularibacter muris]|uniref:N-acetylmuramoyl-L-alanine amidase n=1 Tax=Irregularibacter muris TaxID=1796619 RepID=A0AAE3HCV0_9FIRM|nr:N-acetylmuramoyl-L-alanine amidase [Irregularibacter muris]MCR1897831.1 N-acetylmuramoyl-L-alanine amidase [Irregularibacter muris]